MIYKIKISKKGMLLSEVLQKNEINLEMPCSGNRTCGKCKIKVKGKLSEISDAEKIFLTNNEILNDYRLACFTKVYSDISIEINDTKYNKILTDSIFPEHNFNPILKNNEYGISIDIGTTTIVIYLFKGDLNRHIKQISRFNNQKIFGADIISRIDYSINNSLEEVHNTIITQLNSMIKGLISDTCINKQDIKYAIVTGNTTMLHFFAGLDPKGIAFTPFTPTSLFGYFMENTIGLYICKRGRIYLPPCISAYVGADLVCCILASNMVNINKDSFILDIGTNGEMALFKDNKLICCSIAAGPAFEGSSIKHGMPSIEGAINKVYFDETSKSIKYETINNEYPAGICGTGIIDIISIFLRLGIIDSTGRILDKGHGFIQNVYKSIDGLYFKFDNCDICITQNDIRQVQLAKAAIAAGIDTLLEECNINIECIDTFYISGGFGTFLNLSSAENIGLIPQGISYKTRILGNAALMGASLVLLDKSSIDRLDEISNKCDYIELSSNQLFIDKYIDHMSFNIL